MTSTTLRRACVNRFKTRSPSIVPRRSNQVQSYTILELLPKKLVGGTRVTWDIEARTRERSSFAKDDSQGNIVTLCVPTSDMVPQSLKEIQAADMVKV